MVAFDLPSNPNMEFSRTVEGVSYFFHLCFFRGLMYVTIEDMVPNVLARAARCVNKQWLIGYPAYRSPGKGDFRFEDMNGNYPDYRNFGKTCRLCYYTAAEIAEMGEDVR